MKIKWTVYRLPITDSERDLDELGRLHAEHLIDRCCWFAADRVSPLISDRLAWRSNQYYYWWELGIEYQLFFFLKLKKYLNSWLTSIRHHFFFKQVRFLLRWTWILYNRSVWLPLTLNLSSMRLIWLVGWSIDERLFVLQKFLEFWWNSKN